MLRTTKLSMGIFRPILYVCLALWIPVPTHTDRPQHKCITNLGAILEEAGSDLTKVVKVNVFLSDMNDFAKMNEVYMTYWGDVKPCRT